MNTDESLPPVEVIAERFVNMLESRGATFALRPGSTLWDLNLDAVADITTKAEAKEIADAAFDIRDAIRALLLLRRAESGRAIH